VRTPCRQAATVTAIVALLLTACGGGDADPGAVDEPIAAESDDEAEGEDAEERERPRSTISTESVDAPRSEAEIRVGEIIVEFDGEVIAEGTLLTLEEPILFDFDSDQLKPSAREALDDIAEVLAYYEQAPVQVLGHTDAQGSAEYNLALSQRRADAVTSALVDRGIPTSRLTSEGRGLTEPVASNDTDEGRAQNRRVEILIEGVEPPETG
jgi:outer membrane protein OmpA-like peptidoglycan-associated protein